MKRWDVVATRADGRGVVLLMYSRNFDAAMRRAAEWQWFYDHDGAATPVVVSVCEAQP